MSELSGSAVYDTEILPRILEGNIIAVGFPKEHRQGKPLSRILEGDIIAGGFLKEHPQGKYIRYYRTHLGVRPLLPSFDYLRDNVIYRSPLQDEPFETPTIESSESTFLQERLAELQRENFELRLYVEHFLPHKRILSTALLFLMFFSGVLTVQAFSALPLISARLGWTGLVVSAGAVLLSLLAGFDWQDWKSSKDAPR